MIDSPAMGRRFRRIAVDAEHTENAVIVRRLSAYTTNVHFTIRRRDIEFKSDFFLCLVRIVNVQRDILTAFSVTIRKHLMVTPYVKIVGLNQSDGREIAGVDILLNLWPRLSIRDPRAASGQPDCLNDPFIAVRVVRRRVPEKPMSCPPDVEAVP